MTWYDRATPRERLRALIDECWTGTDEAFAKGVPISPGQLSRLLNGRSELRSSRKIGLILDRLGGTEDELWHGPQSPSAHVSPWDPTLTFYEGHQIIGHLKAELLRAEEGGDVADPQAAFERVERRLLRLQGQGELSDAGWQYWLALREGAILFGGYDPPDPTDRGSRGQNTA